MTDRMHFQQCKCGSNSFYMLQKISGYGQFYVNNKGEPLDNSELHDNLEYKDVRKHYSCSKCDKRSKTVN